MGKKLYVGNLPYSANDDSLKALFEQAGTVESAKVIMDRETGRCKGFGFVEMSTDEEADEAVKKLNDADFEGRAMKVAEARPQAPRTGGGGGRGGGGGGRGGYGGGGGGGRGGFGGGGGGGRY
jgi:RNA recognition motif-containing protein